ncbi:MAG: RNA polymerase sigma factor [Bacteroidota bacterium]
MLDVTSQLISGREKFLAYIRKRISDPNLAEDILQDSLLKAIQAAPAIKDQERLVKWFYRILQNAIVDAYRRKAAEMSRRINYAHETEQSIGTEDERSICECLNEILPTLKPEYEEVLKLVELDEEDPEVVAQRLGISRNNLKVRTHRARQALRRRLEETCRICAIHHCMDCSCKK